MWPELARLPGQRKILPSRQEVGETELLTVEGLRIPRSCDYRLSRCGKAAKKFQSLQEVQVQLLRG